MAISNLAYYGDSITEGTNAIGAGGQGSWTEWTTGLLTAQGVDQPLIGPGLRGLWTGDYFALGPTFHGDEWDAAGTWTHTSTAATYNKAPHGQMWEGANGNTSTATYSLPIDQPKPVCFAIHYVDKGGDWQYQIDGGAWTNLSTLTTVVNDGRYKKVHVPHAFTGQVSFRQYNGTSSAMIALIGIEPYWVDPTGYTSADGPHGTIAHNLGRFGFPFATTSGMNTKGGADAMAFYDDVDLLNGAVSHKPSWGTMAMGVNDAVFFQGDVDGGVARYATNLTSWWNRAQLIGIPWVFINYYEVAVFGAGPGINGTLQQSYRTDVKTFSAATTTPKCYCIDIFDLWNTQLGMGGVGVQGVNDALMLSDGTHPSAAGNYDIGTRLVAFVRANNIVEPSGISFTNPIVMGKTQLGAAGVQLAGSTGTLLATDVETGTGVDAGELISIADTDVGSGTDAGELVGVSDTDVGSGTDGAVEGVLVQTSDTETGVGTDGGESLAVSDLTESGSGTDGGEGVAVADSDTGSGADGGEGLVQQFADSDSGSGADGGEVVGTAISDTDSGSGADGAESVTVAAADTESGSSVETEHVDEILIHDTTYVYGPITPGWRFKTARK